MNSEIEQNLSRPGVTLVTGASGYVGSHVLAELERRAVPFVGIDSGRMLKVTSVRPPVLKLSMQEWPSYAERNGIGVSNTIHLAGVVGDPACGSDPELAWKENYYDSISLFGWGRRHGVRRFTFASSCSVFGTSIDESADEIAPLSPLSVYAETKLRMEHHLLAAARNPGEARIARFATLYGRSPRSRLDLVANRMMASALVFGYVEVHGGAQNRPLLNVSDGARALVTLALEDSDDVIYNIGSRDSNISILELGRKICRLTGADLRVTETEDLDARNYSVCFDRFLHAFPDFRFTNLAAGLLELRDHFWSDTTLSVGPDATPACFDDFTTLGALTGVAK